MTLRFRSGRSWRSLVGAAVAVVVTIAAATLPAAAQVDDPGFYDPDRIDFFYDPDTGLWVLVTPRQGWPETGPTLEIYSGFISVDIFDPTTGDSITVVTLEQHDGVRSMFGSEGPDRTPFSPSLFVYGDGSFAFSMMTDPQAGWQYWVDSGVMPTVDSDFIPSTGWAGELDPVHIPHRDPRAGAVSTWTWSGGDPGQMTGELVSIPVGDRIPPPDSDQAGAAPDSGDAGGPTVDETAAGATTDPVPTDTPGDTPGDAPDGGDGSPGTPTTAGTGGSSSGSGAAGGGAGANLPAWLIGVLGVIVVVLGGYLFARGRLGGRGVPVELGREVTHLPPDEKHRVVREFRALPADRRQAYIDYVKELSRYHTGQRSAPPDPPADAGSETVTSG